LGSNLEEYGYFISATYNAATPTDAAGWLKNYTSIPGADTNAGTALFAYYNTSLYSATPSTVLYDTMSKVLFQCPIRRMARYISSTGAPVYQYAYGVITSGPYAAKLAGHSLETLYFLRPPSETPAPPANFTFTPAEQAFGLQLQYYWWAFVVNGNPNLWGNIRINGQPAPSGSSPPVAWPKYNAASDTILRLGDDNIVDNTTIFQYSGQYNIPCNLWDAAVPVATYTPRCAVGSFRTQTGCLSLFGGFTGLGSTR
jgi:carboxylesterase type B